MIASCNHFCRILLLQKSKSKSDQLQCCYQDRANWILHESVELSLSRMPDFCELLFELLCNDHCVVLCNSLFWLIRCSRQTAPAMSDFREYLFAFLCNYFPICVTLLWVVQEFQTSTDHQTALSVAPPSFTTWRHQKQWTRMSQH